MPLPILSKEQIEKALDMIDNDGKVLQVVARDFGVSTFTLGSRLQMERRFQRIAWQQTQTPPRPKPDRRDLTGRLMGDPQPDQSCVDRKIEQIMPIIHF